MSTYPSVLEVVFRCNCGATLTSLHTILEALNLKEAHIEALERGDVVMRLLLQRLLCDCEPRALDNVALTTVPSTHDFGCAYRREMQSVLAALAEEKKP
jgi:hypothetical protein